MVALSKPSARSSSRKFASLKEVPSTDVQQNPLPPTRRGKRTCDSSLDNLSNASTKRQKASPDEAIRSKDSARGQAFKSLPLRDKFSAKDDATQVGKLRKQDLPQTFLNNLSTTSRKQQPLFKTNNLDIHTSDILGDGDKRSLRSHAGGSRSKSELALYFPDYDELISIEPKNTDLITAETILHITDEPCRPTTASSTLTNSLGKKYSSPTTHQTTTDGSFGVLALSEETFKNLNDANRIDLASLGESSGQTKDPLNDEVYFKAHRRAERQEKQLRNIEKERAMHEKVQLERLLDGLRGHDWLRVMGISGITDGEKKAYEPRRDHLIHEVRILLEKFRAWKEEEKRRRVEREESILDEDDEQEEASDDEENISGDSDHEPHDSTDVDASAARQLHHEAKLATKVGPGKRSYRKKGSVESSTEKPFTSFYSKSYLRDAAIGKHRRGRARFAFGQPMPDLIDRIFDLPDDILTPEALTAIARKKRVSKRHGNEE